MLWIIPENVLSAVMMDNIGSIKSLSNLDVAGNTLISLTTVADIDPNSNALLAL
jgi:hypothetical protein